MRWWSNPLMLSMMASVYELRKGIDMPSTVAELYEIASEAMLARGHVASDALRRLLQAVFFEAHVDGKRVIEEADLGAAARPLGRAGTPRTLPVAAARPCSASAGAGGAGFRRDVGKEARGHDLRK